MTIFDVFRQPIIVTRKVGSTYIRGREQQGVANSFTILASVQPAPARVMETLPEGYRIKSVYLLITDTELFVSSSANDPDEVLIGLDKYLVTKVERWQNRIIPHYEVVVVKEDKDVA